MSTVAFNEKAYQDLTLRKHSYAEVKARWGRIKGVTFTGGPEQLATLVRYRRGESDGRIMAGRQLNRLRLQDRKLRAKLQRKNTKSARHRAQRRRRKEARRARDVNHKIAKYIVAEAERTGRGIGLEDLTGIRERVRLRKPQRAALHSWAFAQLGAFIAYKARRAGVPVVYVDPAYTSRTCAECGYEDEANRVSQARFACRSCGFVDHADRNSSRNIRARAQMPWRRGARSTAPAISKPEMAGRGRQATASGTAQRKPAPSGEGS